MRGGQWWRRQFSGAGAAQRARARAFRSEFMLGRAVLARSRARAAHHGALLLDVLVRLLDVRHEDKDHGEDIEEHFQSSKYYFFPLGF